ncbi:MAG: Hsp33 family molecular chaperone HslO [Eubacteriales bacterium]|nr:Hsp33 family molecular chaperone HslO [Eubacteriales bacterium]
MYDTPFEAMDGMIYNANDAIMRMTLMGGQARVIMCRTTRMTQAAQDTHLASDAAAAAFGRILPATAMLSTDLKTPNSSVTVTFNGNGPAGKIICVGHGDTLKITADNPQAEVPPLKNGAQDVPAYIGSEGTLTVIKDIGTGDPYVGVSKLKSGGVGEDFALYYTVSEQVPSIVALGCLNANGTVLSSGGILVQALPGADETTLKMLEDRIPFYSNISREIYDMSMQVLAENWFKNMDLKILSYEELKFACDCSREKMRNALIAAGRAELEDMIQENKDVEMTCWFCRTKHSFPVDEIKNMLKEADTSL